MNATNFSSVAIQVGGIGSLAPERRSEMAKMSFRAMVGGLLAAYMTASLAEFSRFQEYQL
jgi:CNT family concentrative nucleoside transporter